MADHESGNVAETQEKDLIVDSMTRTEALKKEMNKSLKESDKNTRKPWSKMNKTVQDLNLEIKSIKKTQSGNAIFRNSNRNLRG